MLNVTFDMQVYDFLSFLVRDTKFRVVELSPVEYSSKIFYWNDSINFSDPFLKLKVSYFKIEDGLLSFYCL